MARNRRRPKTFGIGDVRVKVVRGPHRDDPARWYWRARRFQDGGEVTVWTGWATKAEVTKEVAALVASGAAHEPRPARSPAEVRTLRDMLEFWIGDQEARVESGDLAPRTLKNYRGCARHLVRGLGDVLLERLDLPVLDHYVRRRREDAQPSSVKLELKALKFAWKWATSRGLVEYRPLSVPRINEKPEREKRTPTRAEVWEVIDHLEGWPRLAVMIFAHTGARIGEVAKLTWKDLERERGEIRIRKGKTGYRRVVVDESLFDAFEVETPEEERDGSVWPVQPISVETTLCLFIRRACEAAGVTYFTPHGIRRMVIDAYYEAGVDVGTVAAQVGQCPAVALKYYRQATDGARRRAVALAGLGRPASNVVPFRSPRADSGTD